MQRIAIHSVPRSGSSWLGAIFDSHPEVCYKYQPLFSYALKGYLTPESSSERIQDFFQKLLDVEDEFMDQKAAKQRGTIPTFAKSAPIAVAYKEVRYHHILRNMLTQDPDLCVIGLVRNPLAVIHSWIKAPREFRKDLGWQVQEEWRFAPSKNQSKPEEFYGYEKWKETTSLFQQLSVDFRKQFMLLSYSDLLRDPVHTVSELFQFAGLDLHPQTVQFIQESTSHHLSDVYAVYKTRHRDHQWKGKLPAEIEEYVRIDLKGTTFEAYLRD